MFSLIRQLYQNLFTSRMNELYGKLTGTFAYAVRFQVAGFCFEACKVREVWPEFMESFTMNWDSQHADQQRQIGNVDKRLCISQLAFLTRRVPSEVPPQIDGLVR